MTTKPTTRGRITWMLATLLLTPLAVATIAEDVGLLGRIHFNTQTSDFDRARAFYRLLGYTDGVGNFPKTNTHLMARSLGMYDLCTYELESIEVIHIPDAQGPTAIDLIKFAVPYNDEAPYASPTHRGMAYAALSTPRFDHDYAFLRNQGVGFLSAPAGAPGDRFVFMQDPDGVYFKLVEGDTHSGHKTTTTTAHINAMPYIGVNVRDFDAALRFYENIGYSKITPLPSEGTLQEARAYGLDAPFRVKSADVSLPGGDGNRLRITQWLAPYDDAPPYPAPISHIGIHRIALAVDNLDRAVEALRVQGVEFLSEIAPCCSGTGLDERGIINAIDPDGIFVELVGPIKQRPLPPLADICK